MAYKTLVTPDFGAQSAAGGCLIQAQKVVGAGGGLHSATSAANQTQFQHWDRDLPTDALAVVWFSHWGTYWNYIEQRYTYEDYGHVVVWSPDAFGIGQGGFYSSPRTGIGGEWFRTIAEVETAFNSVYRFWSEDLNGVRVCEPDTSKVTHVVPPKEEDELTPAQEKKLDRVIALLEKMPDSILNKPVKRTGTGKAGKPRTGTITLRGFLAGWHHQVGITRRIVERINKKVSPAEKPGDKAETPVKGA